MQDNRPLISIVTPMLNEEEGVSDYYNRVTAVLDGLVDYQYEIVVTDNHSSDRTFELLTEIAAHDARLKIYRLSRDYGYQRSIWTGYTLASGEAAIQLDADLQDPPELIPRFLNEWRGGAKVVYGVRRSRREGLILRSSRRAFYRLAALLSEDELPVDAGDFRLVDRAILDILRAMPDAQPYLRGAIAALGFEQVGIPYDRDSRHTGETKFKLRQLVSLSLDAILNHSVVPLRIASYTGLFVAGLFTVGLGVFIVGRLVFGQAWPAGFATTTALILLSISLNGLFLGIIGEYLGRIYRQVKPRPITVIEQSVNAEAASLTEQQLGSVQPCSQSSHQIVQDTHPPRRPCS